MRKAVKPLTHVVGMKNWNEKKRRWDGVICQAVKYDDDSEGIVIFDVMCQRTEKRLDEEIEVSLTAKPWLKDAEKLWAGPVQEPKQEH